MKKIALITLAVTFTLAGCSQSQNTSQEESPPQAREDVQAGDYGSDPYFDGLYDDCESGDAAACENLYLESPIDSEYESFAMEQGGGPDFDGEFSGGETTAAPTVENVSLNESFTSQGFEWVISSVEIQDSRMESTDYGDSSIEGPWVVLEGTVTNTTEEYAAPDPYGLDVYTSQTSHNLAQSLGYTVDYEEDLFGGEVAPDYTKEGIAAISLESPDEEPLYLEFIDPVSMEPQARLDLEGTL